jgi:hypothetical protein
MRQPRTRRSQSVIFPKMLPAILLLIFFAGIVLALLLPVANTFEGNLTVKEMSFTSNEDRQLFLQDISEISQISLASLEENQSFSLVGSNFKFLSHPEINSLPKLEIQLVDKNSQLIISPEKPDQTSELILEELRLQKNTKVTKLSYNSYPYNGSKVNHLELSLQPDDQPASLHVNLGESPLKVILEGYKIPQLGLEDSQGKVEPLEFTFQPDSPTLVLPLKNPVNLLINLPEPNQTNSEQWFRGQIEVKDVKFKKWEQAGTDDRDSFPISLIMQGSVRMAEQELKIEDQQFLTIANPGIQRLPYLKISDSQSSPQDLEVQIDGQTLKVSKPPQGLDVRVSGKSKEIQVGIDPKLPIASIRGNFWANYLPKDVIIALISFSSAMIVSLLTWLATDFSQTLKP